MGVIYALGIFLSECRSVMHAPGGRGGIRTHGRLAPTAVFKTAALNHSATRPGAPGGCRFYARGTGTGQGDRDTFG